MNRDEVKNLIQEELRKSQFKVSGVPYHIHNGIDSPLLTLSSGYFVVAKTTVGTTAQNVFPKTTPSCTITGVYLIANDGTTANITLKNNGHTVATIAKGGTAGTLVGAPSLSNATYVSNTPITVVSDSTGNATLFMTFQF